MAKSKTKEGKGGKKGGKGGKGGMKAPAAATEGEGVSIKSMTWLTGDAMVGRHLVSRCTVISNSLRSDFNIAA